MQLLRVQSPEGTKRIEILPSASLRELYESIHDAFQLDGYNFSVYGERSYKNELVSSRSQTIDDFNLKHGDMVYMKTATPGASSVRCKYSKYLIILNFSNDRVDYRLLKHFHHNRVQVVQVARYHHLHHHQKLNPVHRSIKNRLLAICKKMKLILRWRKLMDVKSANGIRSYVDTIQMDVVYIVHQLNHGTRNFWKSRKLNIYHFIRTFESWRQVLIVVNLLHLKIW